RPSSQSLAFPEPLVRQFAQVIVRGAQHERWLVEIEDYVRRHGGELARKSLILAMDDLTFQRWTYLDTSRRGYSEAASRLGKDIFGEQHQEREIDLVANKAPENSGGESAISL